MHFLIYLAIFFSKILENGLSTLRLILVSNGKKFWGAFLQFLVAIVWVLVTGVVIIDIDKDILKVVFFALGTFVGSYLGSIVEEKIALGNNLMFTIINEDVSEEIIKILVSEGHEVTNLETKRNKSVLMITASRKNKNKIINLLKSYDKDVYIIYERANFYHSQTV